MWPLTSARRTFTCTFVYFNGRPPGTPTRNVFACASPHYVTSVTLRGGEEKIEFKDSDSPKVFPTLEDLYDLHVITQPRLLCDLQSGKPTLSQLTDGENKQQPNP